jgi:hypothetical protein
MYIEYVRLPSRVVKDLENSNLPKLFDSASSEINNATY